MSNFYRDHAGQRLLIRVRVSKHDNGIERSFNLKEVRYAILEDEHGVNFSARVPQFGISSERYSYATAKIHHVGIDGVVYLKNLRLKKGA